MVTVSVENSGSVEPAKSLVGSDAVLDSRTTVSIGILIAEYDSGSLAKSAQLVADEIPREFSLLPIADDLVANTFMTHGNSDRSATGPIRCVVSSFWPVSTKASDADDACGRALFEFYPKLKALPDSQRPDVLVTMPADVTFDARRVAVLCSPVIRGEVDIAVGSRQSRGSLSPNLTPRHTGQDFAAQLLFRAITEKHFTDFSPLRAMRVSQMDRFMPRSLHRAWAFEMQWRAVRNGIRIREIDAGYRQTQNASPSVFSYAVGLPWGVVSALMTVVLSRK